MDRKVTTTRTLLRGLRLLELIADGSDGSVTQLAAAADLDKGTVSRLLTTLREAGYVRQGTARGRYELTGKVLHLASAYSNQLDLRGVAHPHLVGLGREVDETVHLGVLEGDRVVYIDKVEAQRSIRMVSSLGHTEPVCTTALGRSMLSRLPVAEREQLVRRIEPVALTSRTTTDPDKLLALLAECERRGYAVDDEENQDHVTCVGAAIVDSLGTPVAALSCSGPSYRVAVRIDEIGVLTQRTALAISRELSGER